MKKSRSAYIIVLAVLLLISGAATIVGGIALALSAACGALAVWWSIYYLRLRYRVIQDVIYVQSGLIFRRTREIPIDSILWVTRLELPLSRRAIASVLHTAGGWIVIFNDFSTMR